MTSRLLNWNQLAGKYSNWIGWSGNTAADKWIIKRGLFPLVYIYMLKKADEKIVTICIWILEKVQFAYVLLQT